MTVSADKQCEIVAIALQKGGVGKTTTTINLGANLAAMGLRVLVIDMDQQAHSTKGWASNSTPRTHPCTRFCTRNARCAFR